MSFPSLIQCTVIQCISIPGFLLHCFVYLLLLIVDFCVWDHVHFATVVVKLLVVYLYKIIYYTLCAASILFVYMYKCFSGCDFGSYLRKQMSSGRCWPQLARAQADWPSLARRPFAIRGWLKTLRSKITCTQICNCWGLFWCSCIWGTFCYFAQLQIIHPVFFSTVYRSVEFQLFAYFISHSRKLSMLFLFATF